LIAERTSAAIMAVVDGIDTELTVFDHLVQVRLRRHKRATSPIDAVDGSSTGS
jgi:hypothetical protein